MAAVARIVVAVWAVVAGAARGLLVRFTWIHTHAKCPRCGHFRGGILFDDERSQIVHQCRTCSALWAEEPMTKTLPARKTDA